MIQPLKKILMSTDANGVVFLGDEPNPPADLLGALRKAGWAAAEMAPEPNRLAVLTALGEALQFPSYYGRNLDALADCLTDITAPTALVWHGWPAFCSKDPISWSLLRDVLSSVLDEGRTLALILN